MIGKMTAGATVLFLGLAGPALAQPLGSINGVGDARARNELSVVGVGSVESPYFRFQPGTYVPAYGQGYGIPSYGPGPFYGAPAYAETHVAPVRGRVTIYNEGRSIYRPAPRFVQRRAYVPRRVRAIRVYRPFS